MKRLLKKALIGNISRADIEFIENDGMIEVKLINDEKSLHNRKWDDADYYSNGTEGVVAFIKYLTNNAFSRTAIYVNFLEVMPEYRSTRIALYLLREFQEKVVNQVVQSAGEENVSIVASFANQKLKETLQRIVQNGLYDIEVLNKDEFMAKYDKKDTSINNNGMIGNEPITTFNGRLVVKNPYADSIFDILSELGVRKINGTVDNEANIYITIDEQGAFNDGLEFIFDEDWGNLTFGSDITLENFKQINLMNFSSLLDSNMHYAHFKVQGESYDADEFLELLFA